VTPWADPDQTPPINPKDMRELAEPLRSRRQTMMHDAPGGGLVLVSGFRDPGRQWDLRNARCPGRECDRGCRGKPLTALPGRSNHQRRTAADIGGRNLAWATGNKSLYRLATPVRGEPRPFESAGRPSVTIRSIGGAAPRALEEDLTEDKLRKGRAQRPGGRVHAKARWVRGISSWERYLQVLLDAARKRRRPGRPMRQYAGTVTV
jgi:hypothetical protein